MMDRRGVYFLANDFVLDRAIAFLNSFRKFNPSMALCLIPFGDDIEELLALRDRYGFDIWSGDPALLRACDEISQAYHGRRAGHYRKLVAWEGEFDQFIYIDTDTVVLRSVEHVFGLLDEAGFVTGYSNVAVSRKWVWRESIAETGRLSREQIEFAAGTGFVASRKECLRFASVTPRLAAAAELAPHMELISWEMPLLNYLIVTSGHPFTSLTRLVESGRTDLPVEWYAGQPLGEARGGEFIPPYGPPVLLVHWSGYWWQLDRGEVPQLPHRELWHHYRHLDPSLPAVGSAASDPS
jgi:hypothetical protein